MTVWMQALHRRAVDRITDPAHRALLLGLSLATTDSAGWPVFCLQRTADDSSTVVPRPIAAAYRSALGQVLSDAVAGVVLPPPQPVSADLRRLWQQVTDAIELPSTRTLVLQQCIPVEVQGGIARIVVGGSWLAMLESRRSVLEAAFSIVTGAPVAVVFIAGEASPGMQHNAKAPPAGNQEGFQKTNQQEQTL